MTYVTIDLTEEDALIFKKFREHQETIGYLIGYMESLNIKEMRNATITMDIDNLGDVGHTSITKHFRK